MNLRRAFLRPLISFGRINRAALADKRPRSPTAGFRPGLGTRDSARRELREQPTQVLQQTIGQRDGGALDASRTNDMQHQSRFFFGQLIFARDNLLVSDLQLRGCVTFSGCTMIVCVAGKMICSGSGVMYTPPAGMPCSVTSTTTCSTIVSVPSLIKKRDRHGRERVLRIRRGQVAMRNCRKRARRW